MEHQLLNLCRIPVSELKPGMLIINVGRVRTIDVNSNCIVIYLTGSCFYDLRQIPYGRYQHVRILCDSNGKPDII